MSPAKRKIRYAVVGLGHIAQVAVLPAFARARRNSQLVAVVSGDRTKRREISKRYGLEYAFAYDQFEECHGLVDAVYIALPNSMHAEYTIRAAKAGVHVLCEKPMAVTVGECRQMIAACRKADVKLMVAYRLHFETLNLAAMDLARTGRLGELKHFTSSFSNRKPALVKCRAPAATDPKSRQPNDRVVYQDTHRASSAFSVSRKSMYLNWVAPSNSKPLIGWVSSGSGASPFCTTRSPSG